MNLKRILIYTNKDYPWGIPISCHLIEEDKVPSSSWKCPPAYEASNGKSWLFIANSTILKAHPE